MKTIAEDNEPTVFVTDVSTDAIEIKQAGSILHSILRETQVEDINTSKTILADLLRVSSTSRERYNELREAFPQYKGLDNNKLLERVYLDGYFVSKMKMYNKDNVVVFIFGNETRGASDFAKSLSHYRLTIPHFGYSDTSYNLSVSCGMVLFYLYNINLLPGCFLDFSAEKGVEQLALKMLTNFKKITREEILNLDLNLNDL
jgi:tRNA(Leu) C34 or U34 (ribose-2'-O)-methylase TrmL